MKWWMAIFLVACASVTLVWGQSRPGMSKGAADAAKNSVTRPAGTRFAYVDVYLDPKAHALGAYQFEFAAETGHVKVVGVEGGEPTAFATPPYYDAAALGQNRLILAAFSMNRDLPRSRARIA